jgi:23S rRNA (guanosine2251-2'-O)-methyltransferase
MAHMIYGIHPVKESLKSSHTPIQEILIGAQPPSSSLQSVVDLAAERKIQVTFTTKENLERLARGGLHQNVIAMIQETSYADIDEVLGRWKREGKKAFFLILDSIQDPQNLGSLIRTSLGCGVHGIIIPKDRAVGITPSVVKASAGATAHLPIVKVVNIANTIDVLRKEGIWVYGASGEASELIYDLDLDIHLAIVLGAEGKGIRPLVKKKCDRLFSIPMKGPVSSFNVSVSGGMILYEVMRQRYPGRNK